jgi:hypothetical protein
MDVEDQKPRWWQHLGGLILAGFFGEVGKLVLTLFVTGRFDEFSLVLFAYDSNWSKMELAVHSLLAVAFWLAMFGVLAAIAFGVAGVTSKVALQRWCYAIGNSCHLASNLAVLVVVARALNAYV